MKLICQIELPDDADYKTKLDAMAEAGRNESKWKRVETRENKMKQTSLENKCGSCNHFVLKDIYCSKANGECLKGRAGYRERTRKACKLYERKQKP